MSEGEVKTVTELKIFFNGKIDKIDDHLEKMESYLTTRLEKIDDNIRGKGKVDINVQIRSLEEFNESVKKSKEMA